MTKPDCIFCQPDNPELNTIIEETDLAYARWDNFPASDGHAEVVPKRHVESYFDLTEDELVSIHGLAKATRLVIDGRYHPDGYTIRINKGDVANPRGGIRHIIPGKDDY